MFNLLLCVRYSYNYVLRSLFLSNALTALSAKRHYQRRFFLRKYNFIRYCQITERILPVAFRQGHCAMQYCQAFCGNYWISCDEMPKCLFGMRVWHENSQEGLLQRLSECYCPLVDCEYWLTKQKKRLFKLHYKECWEKLVNCKSCGGSYTRKRRTIHENEECFISCLYSSMGCSAKQTKLKDYEKHFLKSEEAHILLALK